MLSNSWYYWPMARELRVKL